jgi:hypothetical protein
MAMASFMSEIWRQSACLTGLTSARHLSAFSDAAAETEENFDAEITVPIRFAKQIDFEIYDWFSESNLS